MEDLLVERDGNGEVRITDTLTNTAYVLSLLAETVPFHELELTPKAKAGLNMILHHCADAVVAVEELIPGTLRGIPQCGIGAPCWPGGVCPRAARGEAAGAGAESAH
jgi:hypothetical protein